MTGPVSPAAGASPLGLGSAVALVVANTIGAGVFTTSGFALAELGSPGAVLLVWAVGGAVALAGALSYGALARRIPRSGGEYTFLSATVHPLAGFLAGWISLLAGFTAPIAAAALALEAYLGEGLGLALPARWTGTLAIVAAWAMHAVRPRTGVALQNAAVAAKLVAIALFVLFGLAVLPAVTWSAPAAPSADASAFAVTLVWISFSYSGWNAAVYVASEIRDPERNVGRALWIATLVVAGVYLALNAVFLAAAPADALAGKAEIGAVAAEALGGLPLRRAIVGLIALALFTSISSMVLAGPRVYARMAADGLFPSLFDGGPDVPRAAILLQALLATAVVWLSDLAMLLGYLGFTLGLSSAASVGGLLALRRREGAARVPIPGHPWVPLVFIGATVWMATFMIARRPAEAAVGLFTMASGLPAYWYLRRRASR